MHPDRTDVLHNQCVRFSSPAALNDPFELKPHLAALGTNEYLKAEVQRALPLAFTNELSRMPSELRALLSEKTLYECFEAYLPSIQKNLSDFSSQMMPLLQNTMASKIEEVVGVLCLSSIPDSLLMWAHYADAHRGFVLQFDETSPFFDSRITDLDELRHLHRVKYSATRPSLTLSEVEDASAFLTKGMEWAYEAEWRMIVPLADASRVIEDKLGPIHLYNFPASAVTSVICGCRMLDSKKAEIQAVLAKLPQYAHVRLMTAEIDDRNYTLHIGSR